ncbi:MAG: integrin alpha [Candidatus Fibromonas sp.]|jgi:hypothetical protein|nr:integrin alpha [Candidatus Fibromonas sp.]
MKTLKMGFCLLLVLGAQVFAQRFTAAMPDTFQTGFFNENRSYGYVPLGQSAAPGEKNSSYSNLMLLRGRDTLVRSNDRESLPSYKVVNSYGKDFGDIYPIPLNSRLYSFISSAGDTVYDNRLGAVAVLDSFSDNKKTAIVLFATLKKLIIMELRINNLNMVENSVLTSFEMQNPASQADGSYIRAGEHRRITLLGTGREGNDKIYHIAISNPLYKDGTNVKSGRVDFFSIRENLWTIAQPNTKGIASEGGFLFKANTAFGSDLVSIGDLDGNGYNELAVLAPVSEQFPNGAVYIFFMDNEYTLSQKNPSILTGTSMPWKEGVCKGFPQKCKGMSFAKWKNEPHLLLSCDAVLFREGNEKSIVAFIKDIILDSGGNIVNTGVFSEVENDFGNATVYSFNVSSNPVPIKNHRNGDFAVALPIQGPCSRCSMGSVYVYQVIDADASKNFSVEVGKREIVANIDSLFYKSGTVGYSSKTLAGLAECYIQNINELVCEAAEEAQGSWSIMELSSKSACEPYRVCKRKDTIHVYARANQEPANTALRIPRDIVIPVQSDIFTVKNISSLAYFKNPKNLSTNFSWNQTGLKSSAVFNSAEDQLSIIPFSQKEGIDTLVFNLSISAATDNYPAYIHVADSSKILEKGIPANPGNDTVWNIAQKKYIALPGSNSSGNIYTYDITQDMLGAYAEITGNYLHILKVDVADISIAYTENGQIKHRKITLMPEPQTTSIAVVSTQSMNIIHSGGGLQISGLNGEFELRAYNFKGVEIQRERANAQGSVFVKLRQNCPQIVQIKAGNRRVYMKIVN